MASATCNCFSKSFVCLSFSDPVAFHELQQCFTDDNNNVDAVQDVYIPVVGSNSLQDEDHSVATTNSDSSSFLLPITGNDSIPPPLPLLHDSSILSEQQMETSIMYVCMYGLVNIIYM